MSMTMYGASPGTGGQVVFVGLPFSLGSAHGGGVAKAPTTLRSLTGMEDISAGLWDFSTEAMVVRHLSVSDAGNLDYRASLSRTSYFNAISREIKGLASRGAVCFALGGDHSVTYPIVRGLAEVVPTFQIVHLDAHQDFAPLHEQSRVTHSNFMSFVARLPEVAQVLQVGIRGFSSYLPERSGRTRLMSLETLRAGLLPGVPVYLTIDTDAFDPSVAPGVQHPVPQGLQMAGLDSVLADITSAGCPFIGADWTEFDPEMDARNGQTGVFVSNGIARVLVAIARQLN